MVTRPDSELVVPSDEDVERLKAIEARLNGASEHALTRFRNERHSDKVRRFFERAVFTDGGRSTFEQYEPQSDASSAGTVDLPEALLRVLQLAARELARGNAVAVVPVHKDLTTQEAADILNVSRPYLIKLLEQGDIPHVKTGTHRRIRLSDVLAYKRVRDAERRRALTRLTQMGQEMGL